MHRARWRDTSPLESRAPDRLLFYPPAHEMRSHSGRDDSPLHGEESPDLWLGALEFFFMLISLFVRRVCGANIAPYRSPFFTLLSLLCSLARARALYVQPLRLQRRDLSTR